MKKLLSILFPFRRLKEKNLSFVKKIEIYFTIIFDIVIILWIISLFVFPFVCKEYKYKKIHMYTNQKQITSKEISYLKHVDNYLKNSYLYDENISINIYIVNNSWLYALMVPSEIPYMWKSFAVTMMGSNIVFKKVDFIKNKTFYGKKEENFDAVLIHEVVHTLQANKYSWINIMIKTPVWVREGYPTYVAKKLYIDKPQNVLKDFIKNYPHMHSNHHISEQYKLWMLMVKHAIEKMHKSVDDLHLGKVDYDEVLDSMLQEYNVSKTPSP
jgi:hypothetical protein